MVSQMSSLYGGEIVSFVFICMLCETCEYYEWPDWCSKGFPAQNLDECPQYKLRDIKDEIEGEKDACD